MKDDATTILIDKNSTKAIYKRNNTWLQNVTSELQRKPRLVIDMVMALNYTRFIPPPFLKIILF